MPPVAQSFHLGDAVRKLRRSLHLTIPQVARRARVSTQTLSAIESGAELRVTSLLRIAKALGLDDIDGLERYLDQLCANRLGPSRLLDEYGVAFTEHEWGVFVRAWKAVLTSRDPELMNVCLWVLLTAEELAGKKRDRHLEGDPSPRTPGTRSPSRKRAGSRQRSTAAHESRARADTDARTSGGHGESHTPPPLRTRTRAARSEEAPSTPLNSPHHTDDDREVATGTRGRRRA